MLIDPGQWTTMAPFRPQTPAMSVGLGAGSAFGYAQQGTGGDQRTIPNAGTTGQGQQTYSTQSAPDPYQAIIEAQRRYREESDREFNLKVQQLAKDRDQVAISRNQQEANAWYNRELVKLSQAKLAEDKRQFDTTTQEAIRQFNIKQQELTRQFDITTAEGKRQFDLASAESKRQFDATFGQRAKEFEQDLSYRRDTLTEQMRQYDLTRADERERFAREHGLDIRRLEEEARQYDLTREDERQRFAQNLAEQQRQFDVGATGYINGQATLEREQWQNQALMEWTDRAIALASNPADWVKYKQMTAGVAGAAGEIPGLSWTEGGQQGNTAFSGTPTPNSLGNVLGAMGVGQSAQPGQPTGPAPAPGVPGTPGAAPSAPAPLTPDEMARFNALASRRAEIQEAGQGDLSPADLQALQGYQARLQQTGGAVLTSQEQARRDEILARRAALQGANEGDVSFEDRQELARYQARLGQGAGQGGTMYAGGTPGFREGPGSGGAGPIATANEAGPSAQQPAATTNRPLTNWAQQAASMIPSNDQLKASMSGAERQVWDTADAFARQPNQAAAGWYEQQDPMTRELIRGAAQAQGHDWQTVMSRYNRSRWGGSGSARAA